MKNRVNMLFEDKKRVWAYWRVSTSKQSEGRQIKIFEDYGLDNLFIRGDKITGKSNAEDRNMYSEMKKLMVPGDYLLIKNLDRLGRDKKLILKEYWNLVDKGINILIIDTPYLSSEDLKAQAEKQADIFKDFTMDTGNGLLDDFISGLGELIKKLMIGMIDQQLENEALRAEAERENIALRVKEGVKIAQERLRSENRGWGRPRIEVIPEVDEIIRRWNSKEIMQKEALKNLKIYGIGRTTAYKLKMNKS
jgi:DNA invertase Pin-like site-specific DNA recombinase